jgi:hypothetical protein
MTKSRGIGRGGARGGAGRKKKTAAASIPLTIPPEGLTPAEEIRLARATFAAIAADGAQPASARVQAADKLLDRTIGKPKAAPAAKDPAQPDFEDDGGWGELLNPSKPAAWRAN